ncbi:uncharacterized protein LOC106082059 [Stomoxys calcitrans]|uniref:Uncharacterized protein n=1 Tax=Stomoxys calcitrans TaxID=35570 RepID=A0A1I8PCY1_STOCA|nr:uncharacterized protein LOC106082059 [Stomoxys calcitrans]
MLSFKYGVVVIYLCLSIAYGQDTSTSGLPTTTTTILDTSAVASATSGIEESTTKAAENISENSSVITVDVTATSVSNEISSTTLNSNNGEEITTSSWELIYPDPNSTLVEENTPSSIPSIISNNDIKSGASSKYFKVDDVSNCEKYFGECLRQVLSNVMPKFRNADNDTHSLTGLDPFYINRTSFLYNGGPLNGRITVGYTHVYGLTSMKFRKVIFKRSSVGNSFKIRLSTIIPKVLAKGSYKADLKLNSVAVRPSGEMNITLYGLAVEQLARGEIYTEDEHRFLKLTSINVTAALRDAKINATGLVADLRLNDIILNVANNYWRDIFNIILPDTKDNWSPIIMNGLNKVFSMVPFDFLK